MGVVRSLYTNNNTATITLASLADNATAVSSAINNSSTKFINLDIQLRYRTTTGTSSLGAVTIFLVRSVDGGTTYDDSPTNADAIGVFAANTDSTTFTVSTDTALSGQLPDFFKIAVKNSSGAAFDSTGSNFFLKYNGKQFEVT